MQTSIIAGVQQSSYQSHTKVIPKSYRRHAMRGMGKRSWIKLYVNSFLGGSVRYQLTASERSVWIDLLCLAGISNTPGLISDNDNRAYPHSFLANRFNVPLRLLKSTLSKCIEEGRITEDDQGLHITNWTNYQSEYLRQRHYREKNKIIDVLWNGERLIDTS